MIAADIQIMGMLHVQLAITHATDAQTRGAMKTKDVNSEILYYLSPNTNVISTFLQFPDLWSIEEIWYEAKHQS